MKKKNVSRMITLLVASAVMLSGCGNTVNEGLQHRMRKLGKQRKSVFHWKKQRSCHLLHLQKPEQRRSRMKELFFSG